MNGRAPGHLLLPNELQKRLKSRLLIGQIALRPRLFFQTIRVLTMNLIPENVVDEINPSERGVKGNMYGNRKL